MHNLYCTPLGETVRHRFIAAMADAAQAGKGRETACLLPSQYMLNKAGQEFRALGLAGYEQPKFLSFDDLVREIVATAGLRQRRMDRLTQELLVEQVLTELKAAGQLPYFSSIAAFPGYVGTVTSLLAELKGTGASPEEFHNAAEAREWPVKDKEVLAIYETYQRHMTDLGLADLEELYLLAIAALQDGALVLPYKQLYFSEFYIFTPLQLELVRNLRHVTAMDIGLVYEKNRPAVFGAVEVGYTDLVGMGFIPHFVPPGRRTAAGLSHIRQSLYQPQPDRVVAGGDVTVLTTPHRGKELSAVAAKIKARLLSGQYRPEEIAVVARDTKMYTDFLRVGEEFGFPVSLPVDEQLMHQPLARLVASAFEARRDNGSRHSVLNILKSPLVGKALAVDAEALEQQSLERLVRNWEDWLKLVRDERFAGGDEGRRGFAMLRRMVTALPDKGICGDFTEAVRKFLAGLSPAEYAGEAYRQGFFDLTALKRWLAAWRALDEMLDDIEQGFMDVGQADRKLELAEFAKYFRQAAAGKIIRLEGYKAGGVQVISPSGVRGTSYRTVYLVGLTEGEFPLREKENWLYDESERGLLGELGIALNTAKFRRAEEDLFFAVAAALADESLVLSCREDDATLPSPYVDEVLRLFAADSPQSEKYSVNDLFPAGYDEIYSMKDLAGRTLPEAFGAACPGAAAQAAGQYLLRNWLDDDFARRVAAERERVTACGGVYDGLVTAQDLAVDGADDQAAFSITALEDYAQCPFGYFAKRLLGLDEWAEKEEDAGVDVVGTIYHEVLAAFLRGHAGERLQVDLADEYWGELAGVLDAVCRRLAAQGKIIEGQWWDYQRQRLERTLRRWLDYEIAEQNRDGLAFVPRHLEWGFGLPVKEGMDQGSVAEPLALEVDGRKVMVVGKVDRVDQAGDKFAVVDYKRKGSPQPRKLGQGLDLQVALYIMAVESLLLNAGEQVAGGGYYSVEGCKKEGGMWREELAADIAHRAKSRSNLDAAEWDELQAGVRRFVMNYAEGIRSGFFPVAPAADCPPYCVARDCCRYRRGDAETKQAGGEVDG